MEGRPPRGEGKSRDCGAILVCFRHLVQQVGLRNRRASSPRRHESLINLDVYNFNLCACDSINLVPLNQNDLWQPCVVQPWWPRC